MSVNWYLYRFYSVLHQTILLVNGEPLGQERVKINIVVHYSLQRHSCYRPNAVILAFRANKGIVICGGGGAMLLAEMW